MCWSLIIGQLNFRTKAKALCSIIALLSWTASFAQSDQIEKLQQRVTEHTEQDTARVNRLLDLTNAFPLTETIKIEKLAGEALELSRELHYTAGESRALIMLSRINDDRDKAIKMLMIADSLARAIRDLELQFWATLRLALRYAEIDNQKAINLTLESEILARRTGKPALLSRAQLRAAETYCNLSNYALAMEYALKAQENAIAASCTECEVRIWGRIAAIYGLVGNYEKSNYYYEKQNDYYKKNGASNMLLAQLQFNIGVNYHLLAKKYPEALGHFKRSVTLDSTIYRKHIAYIHMADIYVRTDSLDLAFNYAFSARNMNEGNLVTLANINAILSNAYRKSNMPDSALYHGQLGLTQAKKVRNILNISENTLALAEVYSSIGDFKNAFNYHQQYVAYRDSILNNEVKNKVAVQEQTFELEKKQSEVEALNQQKNSQQKLFLALSATLLLVLVVVFGIFRSNRQKAKYVHQRQLLVATVNTQEEVHKRISRDLHDELGAVLSMARMYLVQSREATNGSPEVKPILQEACDLTEVALATMRRISHEIMPPLLEQFGLIKTLQATANQINKGNQLILDLIVLNESLRFPVATELGLYRITMELINNTIKHANAKRISINLISETDNLVLLYSDDGIGLQPHHGFGRGFNNMETRASVMGGTFVIDKKNTKGFKAAVTVRLGVISDV